MLRPKAIPDASEPLLMLISVFAAPTAYSEWINLAIGHLLDCKYGAHYRIFANTLNDLRAAWDRRDGRAVLLTTDWPDHELSRFLIDAGLPFVAVVDEPLQIVLARFPHMDLVEAIRVATGHLTTLSPAFQHNRLIKIDTRFLSEPLEKLLSALSSDLFGEADHGVLEDAKARMTPNDPDILVQDLVDRYHGFKRDVDVLVRTLTTEQKAAAMSIAESYGPLLKDGTLQRVEWPLELFHFSTPGYKLVGRARTIVSGPFLSLPSGTWRATVQFETVENFSGNEIGAEIWIPPAAMAAQGHLSLPHQGLFKFWLDFEVVNPASRVELSMYLRRGAIEGKLKIRSVSVERIDNSGGEPLALLDLGARGSRRLSARSRQWPPRRAQNFAAANASVGHSSSQPLPIV
jgi:hypothetical protein